MKKITAILVCLLLVASLAVTAFAATTEMTVTAAKTEITRGETIQFSISMTELANVRGAGFALIGDNDAPLYDANVFEFVDGACPVPGTFMSSVGIVKGKPSGSLAFMAATNLSGEIFTFNMKVKDDAPFGETTLTIFPSASTTEGPATATANTVTLKVVCAAHDNKEEVTTPATCEADGVKTITCQICGETKTEPVAKLGHKWNAGTVTTPATCEADGVKTFACENAGCTETKTEAVAKLGHKWNAGTVTTPATCSAEGVKTFACENAGCTETKTEAVAKLAHTEKVEVTKAASCTEEGEQVTTCEVCKEVLKTEKIEKLAHTLDAGVVTKEASCSAEGEKTFTCTVCKATEVVAIAKTEHTLDEGVITTPATTKKEGVKTHNCTVCKEVVTVAIPKLETPATGDNTMILAFVLLMVLSAAGVAVTVIGKKRAVR